MDGLQEVLVFFSRSPDSTWTHQSFRSPAGSSPAPPFDLQEVLLLLLFVTEVPLVWFRCSRLTWELLPHGCSLPSLSERWMVGSHRRGWAGGSPAVGGGCFPPTGEGLLALSWLGPARSSLCFLRRSRATLT